jgi:hypothetical protein
VHDGPLASESERNFAPNPLPGCRHDGRFPSHSSSIRSHVQAPS